MILQPTVNEVRYFIDGDGGAKELTGQNCAQKSDVISFQINFLFHTRNICIVDCGTICSDHQDGRPYEVVSQPTEIIEEVADTTECLGRFDQRLCSLENRHPLLTRIKKSIFCTSFIQVSIPRSHFGEVKPDLTLGSCLGRLAPDKNFQFVKVFSAHVVAFCLRMPQMRRARDIDSLQASRSYLVLSRQSETLSLGTANHI